MNKRNLLYIMFSVWYLLIANTTFAYTRQDTLRGSNGSGRNWWDVQQYDLFLRLDTVTKSIAGQNDITLTLTGVAGDSMQIDLQEPMILDSVKYLGKQLSFVREGNAWWINSSPLKKQAAQQHSLTLYYHGMPRIARLPPWEGGFIWAKDSTGKPWIAVACQGLGASSWWPCKDYQGDEPDIGMNITLNTPGNMQVTTNGQDLAFPVDDNGNIIIEHSPEFNPQYAVWGTRVHNPINTYNVTFYAGDYINWQDTIQGEKGKLDLSFHVLRYNEAKAREQFKVVKDMIRCFEYWMGPYPFYEDGYKLVEAPYLGMEHQSAIAYGNEYKKGYRGNDRSGTGVGDLFDYIIIHESGHEWFGNNITAKDMADNWIHEGFTSYTETLFAEWIAGKDKAFDYQYGQRHNIRNDKPVIGDYDVNDDGSSDKYAKGAAAVHMIRVMMNDDKKFRQLLRGLNKQFYHKTVTTAEVEDYIIKFTGLELKPFFNQYLRSNEVPELEWYIKKKELYYRFTNVVDGFKLPITAKGGKTNAAITPTAEWQHVRWKRGGYDIEFSRDFLIKPKS